MSREIDVAHADLLPIEHNVWSGNLDRVRQAIEQGMELPLIRVMALRPQSERAAEPEAPFILLAGHHRTYLEHSLGLVASRAELQENDTDIQFLASRGESPHGLTTLDEIRAAYTQLWVPDLARHGIVTIDDLFATTPLPTGNA
jgi:hypothetical protein